MKNIFLSVGLLFVFFSSASATAPGDLQLRYDASRQMLKISMKHPTVELREHYIRTITISVNGGPSKIHRLPFQRLASGVDFEVPVELKSGDSVYVKAACSQGGSAEQKLVIGLADDANSIVASDDKK